MYRAKTQERTGSWQPEIDELAYRRRLVARMGGEGKVERHKAAG